MSEDQRRRIDSSGRAQFTRKSTPAEIDRRSGHIVKLWRRGHNVKEICDALDIGSETIRKTLMSIDMPRNRIKGRGPVTGSYPWRDEDVPEMERERFIPLGAQESRWRQSRVVGMAQMLNDEYRETNFSNILANQVTEAEEAGDNDWMLQALATFTSAIEKLERARRVLSDDIYRVRCRDTLEGVEQMRHKNPPLRAVP